MSNSRMDFNFPLWEKVTPYRALLLFAFIFLFALILLSHQLGCESVLTSSPEGQTYEYQFDERPDDWTALFSNYTVGREDDFELESGYRTLPAPLDTTRFGFYLSGNNLSDDLNMFLKHRVEDLEPHTSYEVEFEVWVATDAPSGCAGVGGAPGEAVTVHVAASGMEPDRIVDESREGGYYRLNVAENYTGEAHSWYQATKIGDVANSRDCEEGRQYEIKKLSGGQQTVTTDEEGGTWLLVGTRSGFEATTSLYYTRVAAHFIEL